MITQFLTSGAIINALGYTPADAGAVVMASGTEANPGMFFGAESTTGFYRPAAGELGISILGSNVATFRSEAVELAVGFFPTVTFSPADAGNTMSNVIAVTASGNASGDSDVRLVYHHLTLDGSNSFDRGYVQYNGIDVTATAGTIDVVYNLHNYVWNHDAANITVAYANYSHFVVNGSGNITTARVYNAGDSNFSLGGTGTINIISGFYSSNLGDPTRVNSVLHFVADDADAVGSVTGFYSNIPPGTSKFAFRNVAGANSYFGFPSLTAAAGATNFVELNIQYSGDAGGTTNMRGLVDTIILSGANAVAFQFARNTGWQHTGSAAITQGYGENMDARVTSSGGITDFRGYHLSTIVSGSGTISTYHGHSAILQITGSGHITTAALFEAMDSTFSSTGTMNTLDVFKAGNVGHATLVDTVRGLHVLDTSAATLVEGVQIDTTAGTGKWGISHTGGAYNRISGYTTFNTLVAVPSAPIHVRQTAANATTIPIYLENPGANSAGTEVGISLDATAQGINSRDVQILGGTSSANVMYLRVLTPNGAAPAERLRVAADAITAVPIVITPAATAGAASIRLPHGTAPTPPTNGDMWTTSAGLFVRINGATVGPLS